MRRNTSKHTVNSSRYFGAFFARCEHVVLVLCPFDLRFLVPSVSVPAVSLSLPSFSLPFFFVLSFSSSFPSFHPAATYWGLRMRGCPSEWYLSYSAPICDVIVSYRLLAVLWRRPLPRLSAQSCERVLPRILLYFVAPLQNIRKLLTQCCNIIQHKLKNK